MLVVWIAFRVFVVCEDMRYLNGISAWVYYNYYQKSQQAGQITQIDRKARAGRENTCYKSAGITRATTGSLSGFPVFGQFAQISTKIARIKGLKGFHKYSGVRHLLRIHYGKVAAFAARNTSG